MLQAAEKEGQKYDRILQNGYAAPAGNPSTPGFGTFGKENCRNTFDFSPHRRIPQVPDNGGAGLHSGAELIHFAIKHGIVTV